MFTLPMIEHEAKISQLLLLTLTFATMNNAHDNTDKCPCPMSVSNIAAGVNLHGVYV